MRRRFEVAMRRILFAFLVSVGVCGGPLSALCADYPRWRNDGSGCAADSGYELVDDWKDARLLWMSEEPSVLKIDRGGYMASRWGSGGFANPVMKDNKIYLYFFEPCPPLSKYPGPRPGDTDVTKYCLSANDVFICIDGHTGKTLWRTVYKGEGYNFHGVGQNHGGHYTVCVEDGKVYGLASMARGYCLDAETGAPKWAVNLGKAHDAYAYAKMRNIKTGTALDYVRFTDEFWGKSPKDLEYDPITGKGQKLQVAPEGPEGLDAGGLDPLFDFEGSSDEYMFNGAAVVADGVVFFHGGRSILYALDAETGAVLWTDEDGLYNSSNPAVWRHDGKEYLLSVSRWLKCYEPKTGRVIWELKEMGRPRGPIVFGDYCFGPVIQGGADDGESEDCDTAPAGYEAMYKLTLEGPKKMWQIARGCGYVCPVIYKDILWYYYRGNPFGPGSRPGTLKVPGYRDDFDAQVNFFLGVEVQTGKIVNHLYNAPLKLTGSPVGGDGRMVVHSAQAQRVPSAQRGYWMYDINPEHPRDLGFIRMGYEWCVTPLLVDGKMYYKDPRYMLGCFDLRKDRTAVEKESTPKEWAGDYTRYDLELEDYVYDGQPLRLHLGYRNQKFINGWAGAPPNYNVPLAVKLDNLRLKGGKIQGKCNIYLEGMNVDHELDLSVRDGKVTGTYTPGRKSTGEVIEVIPGRSEGVEMVTAPFADDGLLKLELHHWWLKGADVRYAGSYDGGHLCVQVKGGAVSSVEIKSDEDKWEGTIHAQDLVYDGSTLAGTVRVSVESKMAGQPPLPDTPFVLRIDAKRVCTIMKGRLVIEKGFRAGRVFDLPGMAIPAEPVPENLENAGLFFDLQKSLGGGLTDGMIVSLRTENGKVVEGWAVGHKYGDEWRDGGTQCTSIFPVDPRGLTVSGNTIAGSMEVYVKSDGRIPLTDMKGVYNLKIEVADKHIKGTGRGELSRTFAETRPVVGTLAQF